MFVERTISESTRDHYLIRITRHKFVRFTLRARAYYGRYNEALASYDDTIVTNVGEIHGSDKCISRATIISAYLF